LQHQREASAPQIKKKIKELNKQLKEQRLDPQVMQRFEMEEKIKHLTSQRYEIIHNPKYLLPMFTECRMIRIKTSDPNPIELIAMVASVKYTKKTQEELFTLSSLDQKRHSQNIIENEINE